MFGVSRRLYATVGAAATILVLTTGSVAGADPDSLTSARANGSSTVASVALGAKSDVVRAARLRLDHGGGLQPPATDVESPTLDVAVPATGLGVALATWFLVFVGGVLASLRYLTRRSRL
jgi:hypothetical protein